MARIFTSLLVLSSGLLSAFALPQAGSIPGSTPAVAPNDACAQAQLLAQGIALNIQDQKNEQAAVQQVANVLAKNPVDMVQFTAAKNNLLQFVNTGIAIREMNQIIMPANNKAIAGIAKVANAQLEELGLADSLTGNPATDSKTVQTLMMDFAGGVKQNMQNMADALNGCGPAATAASGNGTISAA